MFRPNDCKLSRVRNSTTNNGDFSDKDTVISVNELASAMGDAKDRLSNESANTFNC